MTSEIPGFLTYKPSEELVQLALQLQQMMQVVEEKVKGTNHIPTIVAQRDQNLPLFQLIIGFTTAAQKDLLQYQNMIAEYLIEKSGFGESSIELAISPDLSEEFLVTLDSSCNGLEEIEKFLNKVDVDEAMKLDEDIKRLIKIVETVKQDLSDMGDSIAENTYEEVEEEDEEEYVPLLGEENDE